MALLLSPIGLLLISAARLIIISNYSTVTAVTIASSGGYVNTLLGSIIPLVPIFMPYIALALLLAKHFVLSILALVFAAFMSPTQLHIPITRRLLILDQQRISAQFHHYWPFTLIAALIIALAARVYHRSLAEALGVLIAVSLVLGLFFLPSVENPPVPGSLRSANSDEDKIPEWIHHDWKLALLIAIVAVGIVELHRHGIAETVSTVTAVAVSIALLPYVINIYPLPGRPEYYFTVLHQPWLPAEDITLSSGKRYVGYVLASDDNWFTVLTTPARSIVYLHTDQIISRTVCEVHSKNQPTQYPPLVTSLYSAPPHVRACARRRPRL